MNSDYLMIMLKEQKMDEKYGWILKAHKKYCARDDWEEGQDAIPGTWDKKEGSWYEFSYACSKCGKEKITSSCTPFCPYCGTPMQYVEVIKKSELK